MEKFKGRVYVLIPKKTKVEVLNIWTQFKRSFLIVASFTVVLSSFVILNQTAQAAQITSRSLSITSAIASATGVTYTFNFTPGTAVAISSITFQLCTSAVGTCSAPTGLNIQAGTATLSNFEGTVSGTAQNTTTTTPVDCTQIYDLCVSWTDSTAQTLSNHTVTVTGVTNPSTIGTFYARITTYSGTFTSPVDTGNVASATTQTFTVNATVEEQLTFCVGSVNGASSTVENATTGYDYAIPACGSLAGSSLSLGTLNSSYVSVSPMSTSQPYNGDLNSAVAELTTNAAHGSVISYNAVQQSGTNHQGALRVPGATCTTGTSYTDQCIISIGPTAAAITAGNEDFGMTVTGINCHNVPTTAYTCNGTTHNLTVNSNYYCNATDAATSFSSYDAGGQVSGTTVCSYAWDESGNPETVATSSSVVGGEALIIEFAATPELTTPTGAYTAQANYVATPTF